MTTPLYNMTDTWNSGATQFSAIKMNVTNTASAAGSRLIDLQVGGNPRFISVIDPGGAGTCGIGVSNYNSGDFGWFYYGSSYPTIATGAAGGPTNDLIMFNPNSGLAGNPACMQINPSAAFAWGSSTTNSAADTALFRDGAASIIAQRQGTNAQTSRVYNSYTNSSNYERLAIDWQSLTNVCMIRTEAAGSGTLRDLWFNYGGQKRIPSNVSFTSTVTLGALANLSVNLLAGRTYTFEVELPFTCIAAGGARAAMVATNGLTATAIIYDGWIVDSASNGIKGNVQSTALGTAVGAVAITGAAGHITIRGTITVNAAGTLNVQGAQGVSSTTATVFQRGGYMQVMDIQ